MNRLDRIYPPTDWCRTTSLVYAPIPIWNLVTISTIYSHTRETRLGKISGKWIFRCSWPKDRHTLPSTQVDGMTARSITKIEPRKFWCQSRKMKRYFANGILWLHAMSSEFALLGNSALLSKECNFGLRLVFHRFRSFTRFQRFVRPNLVSFTMLTL